MIIQALVNVVVLALSVLAVTRFMPGIRCKDFRTALVVAAGVSVLNFVAFKLLFFLAIPFMLLTGFLGYFIINAAILWIVDEKVKDFQVDGVGNLVMGSLAISAVNWVLGAVVTRMF